MANIIQTIINAISNAGAAGSSKTPASQKGGSSGNAAPSASKGSAKATNYSYTGKSSSSSSNKKSTGSTSKSGGSSGGSSSGGSNGRTAQSATRENYLADYEVKSAVERAADIINSLGSGSKSKLVGYDMLDWEADEAQSRARNAKDNYLSALEQSGNNAGDPKVKSAKQMLDDALREAKIYSSASKNAPHAVSDRTSERIVDTVKGAAKSTGAGLVGVAGFAYEGGARGAENQTQNEINELQQRENIAQQMYKDAVAEYNGDTENPNVKARQAYLEDVQRELDTLSKIDYGKLKPVTQSIYDTADKLDASAAEDIARAKEGLGKVGQTLVDVGVAGGQMLGDAALALGSGGMAAIPLALRAFGGAANEARREGAGYEQQALYAAGSAAVEVATEKLFDGLAGLYGKGWLNKAGSTAEAKGKLFEMLSQSQAGNAVLQVLKSMGGEAAEEAVSNIANSVLQSIYNGKIPDENFDVSELLYDALIGGILGGVGGGISLANSQAPQSANNAPETPGDEITLAAEQNAENAASGEFNTQELRNIPTDATISINNDSVARALEMVERGASPSEIYNETGLVRLGNETGLVRLGNGNLIDQATGDIVWRATNGNAGSVERNNAVQQEKRQIASGVVSNDGRGIDGVRGQENNSGRTAPFTSEQRQLARGEIAPLIGSEPDSMAELFIEEYGSEEALADVLIDAYLDGEVALEQWTDALGESVIEKVKSVVDGATKMRSTESTSRTSAETTNGRGPMRERGGSVGIRTNESNEPMLRESFEANPEYYTQLTNAEVVEKANAILAKGEDAARNEVIAAVTKAQQGMKLAPEYVVAAQEVANALTRQGKVDAAHELEAAVIAELTAAGQLGQIGKLIRTSPASVERGIQKVLDKVTQEVERKGFDWKAELTDSEKALIRNTDFKQPGAYEEVYTQIAERVGREMPSTIWEKLQEIRRINMLLRPRTMIKNVASNVPMVGIRKLSEGISAAIQSRLVESGKMDASQQTRARATEESKAIARDYWDANAKDIMRQGNRWDLPSLLREHKTVFKGGALEAIASKITGKEFESFAESLRQVTYDMLERGDVPFMRSAFVDSLAQYCAAHGITDVATIPQAAIDFATANALEATFKSGNALAKALNELKRNSSPATAAAIDIILPFTTTPANILSLMGTYSPIGFAKLLSKDGPAAKIDAFSKASVGTSLMAIGFFLRGLGAITGGEDEDKDKAAFDRATGKGIYSIGGRVSYDWAQPIGSLIALGAEISDALEGQQSWDSAVMNAIYTAGDSVLNMSLFQNVLSVLKGSGKPTQQIIDAIMEGGATQFIPGLAGDIAKIIDGTVRSTYTGGNVFDNIGAKLTANIPFASKTLPESVNVKGEASTRGNIALRTFNTLINPTTITLGNKNAQDEEINRLYEATGSKTHFPAVSPYKIEYASKAYTMNGEERAQFQKTQGQTYYEYAAQALESPFYNSLSDEQKQAVLTEINSYALDAAKREFVESRGDKYSSSLQNVFSGVNKSGTANDVPALDKKNAGEYIAFNASYKTATNTADYAAIDNVVANFNKLDENTKSVIGEKPPANLKNLIKFAEVGSGSETYYKIDEAKATARVELDVANNNGGSEMLAIVLADIPENERLRLIDSGAYELTKGRKQTLDILRSYGCTVENAYKFFDDADWAYSSSTGDYNADGTLSPLEAAAAIRKLDIPESEKPILYEAFKAAMKNPNPKYDTWKNYTYASEIAYLDRTGYKYGKGNAVTIIGNNPIKPLETDAESSSSGGRIYGGGRSWGGSRSAKPANLGDSVAAVRSIANKGSSSSHTEMLNRAVSDFVKSNQRQQSAQPAVNWETLLASYTRNAK